MDVRPRRKKDLEWLAVRVAKERDTRLRDRCRIVLLALRGFMATQIAEKVGCSRRTAQRWVYRYRDEGLEGLHERPRSGQPPKLAPQFEAAFRQRLEAGLTATDLRRQPRTRASMRPRRTDPPARRRVAGARALPGPESGRFH